MMTTTMMLRPLQCVVDCRINSGDGVREHTTRAGKKRYVRASIVSLHSSSRKYTDVLLAHQQSFVLIALTISLLPCMQD